MKNKNKKEAKPQPIKMKNSRGEEVVLEMAHALALLRLEADNGDVKGWSINDAKYQFKDNEIIPK